jgi:hypothetical protein
LIPPGGGGERVVGKMDEADHGWITKPKKTVTGELTHIPDQRLDPQNYEKKESDRCDLCKGLWMQDVIWNAARTREVDRPLTQAEARRVQEGLSCGERRIMRRKINKIVRHIVYRTT